MAMESELLEASLLDRRVLPMSVHAVQGRLGDKMVIVANTGMGAVNAACTLAELQSGTGISSVIAMGIGGAYQGSRLVNGDIAIAREEIYGDSGIAYEGSMDGLREIGIPLCRRAGKDFFNAYPMCSFSADEISRLDACSAGRFTVKSGRFVTVSSVSGDEQVARTISGRFGAICENMEGAALAHACMRYDIPVYEVRGISNRAGVRGRSLWDIDSASVNCQRAVMSLLGCEIHV